MLMAAMHKEDQSHCRVYHHKQFLLWLNHKILEMISQCKSDVSEHEIVVESLKAFESATGLSRIKAMDPASITGSIVAFELAG